MSEKILFTDLDGTLLNSAKKVSPGMQLLLSKMVLAGNRLVLTSGRALPSVLKVAKNAGLLAAAILANHDSALAERLEAWRAEQTEAVTESPE